MTNGERYKTARERKAAWEEYCKKHYRADKNCSECPIWKSGAEECRFAWLDLEYKRPPKTMEEIIAELRDISITPQIPSLLFYGQDIPTIRGKEIRRYLADLAKEIEAAWNRRVK